MALYDIQSIPTLTTALQNETVDTLKSLARLLSSDKGQPIRKAELVDFIGRHLEGEKLKALWAQLDALQQAAIAETVHGPGSAFQGDRFVAKYGQSPNWSTRDRYGYRSTPSLLRLFFYGGLMPDDLRQRFKAFVPKPEPAKLESRDDLPEALEQSVQVWNRETHKSEEHTVTVPIVRCATERAACHDLKAVLRLVGAGKLAVSDKTYQPGEVAMKAVAALLLGGDFYDDNAYGPYEKIGFIKPFAWPLLVQAGGLARLSGKRLELTTAGQKALSAPPEQTLAQLWQRWHKTTLLDELRRIDCIKGQTGKAKRSLTPVAGRRAVIQEALKTCPPERWIGIDELFRQMRATGLTFEVARDFWHLYIADPQYGSLGYDGFHGWNILQGRYMLCVLFEVATTLGLIDVAYIPPHGARPDYRDIWGTDDLPFFSRYDGLQYIRINPLGAYCLGLAASYTPSPLESRAVLQVLPNLEIAVTRGPLEPADELLLDHYAQKVSDAVWKLEPDRLLEAMEAGQSVSALREWLTAHSAQALPETVARYLDDMAHRAGRLQDKGTARLIECADAALAALIANDTRTKPYCLLAGERHLAVPAETETRFRSALRKLGYSLPK
jgi:hypothetical protein